MSRRLQWLCVALVSIAAPHALTVELTSADGSPVMLRWYIHRM